MADFDGVIDPAAAWADVPQLSAQAQTLGGAGGPMNAQAVALAARTKDLDRRASGLLVNTIAELRALPVPPAGRSIISDVLGYASGGDGGGGTFYWNATSNETDDGGVVIQPNTLPAAGRWKRRIDDGFIRPQHFGAMGTGDDTAALQKFFAALPGKNGRIDAEHVCNLGYAWPDGTEFNLEITPTGHLDCSSATGISSWGGVFTVGTDSAGLTALPTLGANVAKNAKTITLASAPSLAPGDLYMVWNDDDFSWLNKPTREYYKAGEFCRVKSVSGAVVTNEKRSFDSYTVGANMKVVKLTTSTVNFYGHGKITFPNATIASGIVINNGYLGGVGGGLQLTGAKFSHVELRRCFETNCHGLRVRDYSENVGLNYAVLMIACFDCLVHSSHVHTTRHGITFTGGGITASIPNRFCRAVACTISGDEMGADMHGAVEHCGFYGSTIYGGVNLGGDYSSLIGCKIFTSAGADWFGVGVRLRDAKGANHTVQDCEIIATDAAIGTDGILEFRLADQYSSVTGLRPGTIRVSGIKTSSDVAATFLARVSLPASVQGTVNLDFHDISHKKPAGTTDPLIRIDGTAGGYFGRVDMRALKGAAPLMNVYAAQVTEIDGVDNDNAASHGCQLSFTPATVPQHARLRGIKTRANQNCGINLLAVAKTDDISVDLIDFDSTDNNAIGTSATRFKSSLCAQNIKALAMIGGVVGDTQATQKQSYSVYVDSCGSILERDVRLVGASLPKNNTNNGTWATSIPVLT